MSRSQGLGDTLFGEVARIARELDQSFVGKDALSQRALSTFRRIREKLGCLAFVDYRVQPVLDSLTDWLGRVPAKGPISGALFNEGFGLMLLVSDPQKMSDHGAGILALKDLIPEPAEAPDENEEEDDERLRMVLRRPPRRRGARRGTCRRGSPVTGSPLEQESFYF